MKRPWHYDEEEEIHTLLEHVLTQNGRARISLDIYNTRTLHFGAADRMWVQFHIEPAGETFELRRYQVDGEDPTELDKSVSTPDTIQFIVEKCKMSVSDILQQGTVKINMKMSDFETRISAVARMPQVTSVPGTALDVISHLISIQQQQSQQQQQLLLAITQSLALRTASEAVKPEIFDGTSSSPHGWLTYYEYACEKNCWITDADKVKNLILYLSKMARSWYELRLPSHAHDSWQKWKENFITTFEENAVERWDRAISFRYHGGSPLEYFFEKRRLLQVADPRLPNSSVVPLVVHGMSRDQQRQVQVKAPGTIDDLLQCCARLSTERNVFRPGDQATWRANRESQGGEWSGWKSREDPGSRQRNREESSVVNQLEGGTVAPDAQTEADVPKN